jgi:hypothetical protein
MPPSARAREQLRFMHNPRTEEPMATTPPVVEPAKPKLRWYQHVWCALPLALVAVGGAIGGACGGAAWVLNQAVFQKTANPILRYVFTGMISATAVMLYLGIAIGLALVLRPNG